MSITIKKDVKKETKTESQPVTIAYLPENLQAEVAQLPAEVQAKFAAVQELTPDLIQDVAEAIPESLLEALIIHLENAIKEQQPVETAPQPATKVMAQKPVTNKEEAERQVKRDTLKAEMAKTVGTRATAAQAEQAPTVPVTVTDAAPTQPVALSLWDQLFPVGKAVTVVNRGNGKFEINMGGDVKPVKAEAAQPATTVVKKPKMSSITDKLLTPEYNVWLENLKTNQPNLLDRIALAESLGLKRGEHWANVSKAGEALPEAIENMYLLDPLRIAMGVEKYVEGARTAEERKAILNGTSPMPAQATA